MGRYPDVSGAWPGNWKSHEVPCRGGDVAEIRYAAGRSIDAAVLKNADALLVRSVTRVDESSLGASHVRFVGSATSGTDHVDLDYLGSRGIAFAYAPGSNANSVVEYVLAVISAVDDKLEALLAGGRVGLIGYGVIGKMLASRFASLGIDHCVYDPWLDQSTIDHPAELEEVLGCDVVTLHAELTSREPWPSFHLLGEPELLRLKSDALMINTSRGPVVDNGALLGLLRDDALGARIVLDVWEGEPQISAELLRRVHYGSPHVAGYSLDGKILATRMLCDRLAEILELQLPAAASPVSPPAPITVDCPERRHPRYHRLHRSPWIVQRTKRNCCDNCLLNATGLA
jgi:erythronate-4-phosphate dehydrogenase